MKCHTLYAVITVGHKKLLTSSIIGEMKNGEKMKQVSSKVQVILSFFLT